MSLFICIVLYSCCFNKIVLIWVVSECNCLPVLYFQADAVAADDSAEDKAQEDAPAEATADDAAAGREEETAD